VTSVRRALFAGRSTKNRLLDTVNRDAIRLDSWKEIADYLGRDVRTAIRWEKERGMPVRRIPGQKGHGVFALREEIEGWLRSGQSQAAEAPCIAVLPFLNSDEPSQEYVSDGITEGVINTLSRTPKVRVMAWSTVRRYRGAAADPRQIGRELSVRAVVTGRLARRNSFWQLNAELVDPADGTQVWGHQYARPAAELQGLPDLISNDILAGLGVQLKAQEKRRLAPILLANPEAFDLYLKARYHANRFTASDFQTALELLERAVKIDPNYAQAYAEMASCYTLLGTGYGDFPAKDFFAKSDWAARKAIEIDDSVGEAHCAVAVASPYLGFDWRLTERELQRAIELSPGNPLPHYFYGTLLSALGRSEEAIEELRWANEIDPYWPGNGDLSFHLALWGRLEEAEEELQKILKRCPEHGGVLQYIRGVVYERQGKLKEAIESLEAAVKMNVMHTIPLGVLGNVYARTGQGEKAREVLGKLEDFARRRATSHFSKALVFAGLAERNEALDSLEQAYEEKSPFLYFLKTYPWFESVREERRFAELVSRVGLPE
jgi:TolB-like protein/Tfp pilus assembly protein PilF